MNTKEVEVTLVVAQKAKVRDANKYEHQKQHPEYQTAALPLRVIKPSVAKLFKIFHRLTKVTKCNLNSHHELIHLRANVDGQQTERREGKSKEEPCARKQRES